MESKLAHAYAQCHKYYMQIKSIEDFPPTYRDADIHIQRYEHMSWRTLNKATVTTVALHTYGLGQRECNLQTLPLSRRRKMGQNNKNRLRCFLLQLSSPLHHTACRVPNDLS